MPFSPLDALLDILPEVRKASKVKPYDTVSSVSERIANLYKPIVEKIRKQAIDNYKIQNGLS